MLKLANGQLGVIAMEIAYAEFLRENQVNKQTKLLLILELRWALNLIRMSVSINAE